MRFVNRVRNFPAVGAISNDSFADVGVMR